MKNAKGTRGLPSESKGSGRWCIIQFLQGCYKTPQATRPLAGKIYPK